MNKKFDYLKERTDLTILVIGGGGRESAIVRMIAQSDRVKKIFCAPGSAGIKAISDKVHIVDIGATDISRLRAFALENSAYITFVGSEEPLVMGIVDEFLKEGLATVGPTKNAARLEGSKIFAKELLKKIGVPSAEFCVFTKGEIKEAKSYINSTPGIPCVVKVDGLAGGKGAMVCHTTEEADTALGRIKSGEFGKASENFLVEKFLYGEEASYIVFVDVKGNILPLASSQDHKSRYEGGKGPNTGGMGAYSPAPIITPEVEKRIIEKIIKPVLAEMRQNNTPFCGVLYVGLMIDEEGNPSVIEFNVRLGDPETQAILPRMKTDLVDVLIALLTGELDKVRIEWDERPAVCVVLVTDGYGERDLKLGYPISGLCEATELGVIIDHAGTMRDESGNFANNGGRVIGVTALGDDFREAAMNAYAAVHKIKWHNIAYRNDIARRVVLNK